jgi:hypothetical protein
MLTLSKLPHTWMIDLDGTLLKHNGYLNDGDELLSGVEEFWASIPSSDIIILLSARTDEEMPSTLTFLKNKGLRFDHAIFSLPKGERILINDIKPSGLSTAYAINIARDLGLNDLVVNYDQSL